MFRWMLLGVTLCAATPSTAADNLDTRPLRIRLFGKKKLTRLEILAASETMCDGQALRGKKLKLRLKGHRIHVGPKKYCRNLTVQGPLTFRADKGKHRFRGELQVSVREGRFFLTNVVAVEDYLLGVLGVEAKAGADAAMQAQAVVSRTYALAMRQRHIHNDFDLCDSPHCQMYKGMLGERGDVEKAVRHTQGEVLVYPDGRISETYFHASCGGATSSPQDVFGGYSDMRGVSDSDQGTSLCGQVSKTAWKWKISKEDLALALGVSPEPSLLKILKRDEAGRVVKLNAYNVPFRADTFLSYVGQAFGYGHLRSAKFHVRSLGDAWEFSGTGSGHGVGLCQLGAWARARRGDSYQAILKHYFPQQQLQKF